MGDSKLVYNKAACFDFVSPMLITNTYAPSINCGLSTQFGESALNGSFFTLIAWVCNSCFSKMISSLTLASIL
jgi:hypothetical protein